MKITVESTSKLVELQIGQAIVPARIWEGHTADGVPVHCYITRICPSIPIPELTPGVEEKFARDLFEQTAPTAVAREIPLRLIL
jgi:hypothetical protein